jgi:amidase
MKTPATRTAGIWCVLTALLSVAVGACGGGARNEAAAVFRVEEATIASIHAAFDAGVLTCRQLVSLYLDRIAAYEDGGPRLNSITTVNPRALEDAAALDGGPRGGPRRPLHCIPILLKDNIDTADMPTSNGSVILKDARPPKDGFITAALRRAGALILGKAAMGEFAAGSYNTIDGQTLNPYHVTRQTGGSSSGSAAAVAANLAVLAIGTDTSTSVRGPSAFNGIVGFRPTTGVISRAGIAPKNLLFDSAGPIARTVADAVSLLDAIAGPDPADPVSADTYDAFPQARKELRGQERRYAAFAGALTSGSLREARLGAVRDFWGGDPEIDRLADAAVAAMQQLGADIVDVRLDPAFLDFYVSQGAANIRRPADYRFRQDWERYTAAFGPEVPKTVAEFIRIYETDVAKSPLPVAAGVLDLLKRAQATSPDDPVYQNLVNKVLPEATRLKLAIFETHDVDALVFPYQPAFASPIENPVSRVDDPAYVRVKGRPDPAIFAGYSSLGFPAIVVPMGFGSHGLPMAISFMGRPYDDRTIIGYAFDYEQATKLRRSPLLK